MENGGPESRAPKSIVASGAEDSALAAGEAAKVYDSEGKVLEQLLMEGCKSLDDGFISAMSGRCAHRFHDAKNFCETQKSPS